jgi:hypothetical protein
MEVDGNPIYSSTEVRIGTWIDGSPIYRKCFEKTSNTTIESGATVTFGEHNITGFDKLIGGSITGRPDWWASNEQFIFKGNLFLRVGATNIKLQNADVYSNTYTFLRIVLEYTKSNQA